MSAIADIPMQDRQKLTQVEHWIEQATTWQNAFDYHGHDYAQRCKREAELEALRPQVKADAVKRLMENIPSISVTRAEDQARLDPEYLAHLEVQRAEVYEKQLAYTRMESARLRAYTALAAIRAIAGII